MSFIKHIGKHNNNNIAILYRKIPGEEHMCLVAYLDQLPSVFNEVIMQVVKTPEAQAELDLSNALFRNKLPDGSSILNTLHKRSLIKKVPTKQVIITPAPNSHVRLDELNQLIDKETEGQEAKEKLNKIRNDTTFDDVENSSFSTNPVDPQYQVLTDKELAQNRLNQSQQMANEAQRLLAESKRLEEEAWSLDPSLKPVKTRRKTTKKKITTKKTTSSRKRTVKEESNPELVESVE